VILVAGGAAIVWSYLSRRGQSAENQFGHLLSSGISRLSKQFEYSQLKGGKQLFRVRAGTNTLTNQAVQILEDVDMVRFDEDGSPTDAVESRRAVYQIEDKKIDFRDEVIIHLSGGTRVFADEASGDLESELISIEGTFRFEQGGIQGSGNALQYSIPEKTIEIHGRSTIDFLLGSDRGSAEADQVIYASDSKQIELGGDAKILTSHYELSADQIRVYLSPIRQVTGIKSAGNAQLRTGASREFTGSIIDIGLDPATGEPNRFEVLAGTSGTLEAIQRAVFQESNEEGTHRLESNRIEGVIAELPEEKGFVLDQLTAADEVLLRSSALGIESCRARFFRADFAEGNQGFEGITLAGDVMMVRRPYSSQPSHQEVLRSKDLEIELDQEQRLRQIQALDEVEIELSRRGIYRHLSARDSVKLTYVEGFLERAVASEDCVLRSIHETGRDMVRAPSLDARFTEGQIRKVLAEGGVDLEFVEGEESVRQTKSEQLELTYRDGHIAEASQWGNFQFWDRTATTSTELVSDEAVYDPKSGVVRAFGEKDALMRSFDSASDVESNRQSETYAKQFILNQKGNQVTATEGVESVVRQNGEPLVLTADRMEIDLKSGWICYSESPRLVQGPNLVTGQEICLNNRDQQLNVRENVKSLLAETAESNARRYKIEADHLFYKNNDSKVTYTGDVQVNTQDLNLTAPKVELFFVSKDLGQLDRIEASGGVVIVEKERTWKGQNAVYYRANERVVVRND
jgi:lipopolysaccharide export system protein LptA